MKILLIILGLFVILDIIIVLYVMVRRMRRKIPAKDIEAIRDNWKRIVQEKDMRHAVMDADKLLDHALFLMGYRGNLGSKLKKSAHHFSKINKVWAAHKVRNNIAHQMNFQIEEKLYRRTMMAFKEAFQDLKIF